MMIEPAYDSDARRKEIDNNVAEAEAAAWVCTMARVYAAKAERRGECSKADLVEHGFDAAEIEDHWEDIVERGEKIIAKAKAKAEKENRSPWGRR